MRGEVEKWIAATGVVVEAAVRVELAEDLTTRVVEACVPLLEQTEVPEHVRALTSTQVLAVEADLIARFAARAEAIAAPAALPTALDPGLDEAQKQAVAVLVGDAQLVVVEGAAGAGKTTTLATTQEALADQGRAMVVVTPTLKAAQVAAREVGTGDRWRGWSTSTASAGTPTAAGPAPQAHSLCRGDRETWGPAAGG